MLVTGATGFVGGVLARALRAEGAIVRALARNPAGPEATDLSSLGVEIVGGHLGDPDAIARASAGCDVVFHCAGVVGFRADPVALRWANVAGTENVINAARHAGVRRLVHLSTEAVTARNADRLFVDEAIEPTTPPISEYARTKAVAEDLVLTANGPTLEATAVRPGWIWGPRDTTNLPDLIVQARRGTLRLPGGGKGFLATSYVDHVVDALARAAVAEAAPGRAYYVTDDASLEVRELVEMLCRAAGVPGPRAVPFALAWTIGWWNDRVRGRGVSRALVAHLGRSTLLNIQRARTDLGYAPFVETDEGMRRVAAWIAEVGGPDAVAAMRRPPASREQVDEAIRAADAWDARAKSNGPATR